MYAVLLILAFSVIIILISYPVKNSEMLYFYMNDKTESFDIDKSIQNDTIKDKDKENLDSESIKTSLDFNDNSAMEISMSDLSDIAKDIYSSLD